MLKTQVEIEKAIKELIEDLNSIILEDNEITTDEQDIIATIEETYTELQKDAKSKSDLTDKEYYSLFKEYMQDIVSEVVLLAREDEIISHSELKMINRIQDFISIVGMF